MGCLEAWEWSKGERNGGETGMIRRGSKASWRDEEGSKKVGEGNGGEKLGSDLFGGRREEKGKERRRAEVSLLEREEVSPRFRGRGEQRREGILRGEELRDEDADGLEDLGCGLEIEGLRPGCE